MESNENRLNVNFAYCKDTEEIVFENGNKVSLKDLVSDYLFQKDATTKENLTVEQIKWERDVAIEQLKELGYGLGEKIRTSEDCISRKSVIDVLTKHRVYFVDMVAITSDLKDLPSVQPIRPKGHWVESENKKGMYFCSCCGGKHTDPEKGEWIELFDYRYAYCPLCGEDLR